MVPSRAPGAASVRVGVASTLSARIPSATRFIVPSASRQCGPSASSHARRIVRDFPPFEAEKMTGEMQAGDAIASDRLQYARADGRAIGVPRVGTVASHSNVSAPIDEFRVMATQPFRL